MDQKHSDVQYSIENSTRSNSISPNNTEVSELQKDFSVTNRLLSESKDYTKSQHADIYPSCYPHGWQYLLPTDQGSVSASRSGWQGIVPNATLPRAPFDLKPDGSSSCVATSGYTIMQHQQTQNLCGQVTQLTGAAITPLHHATDSKEVKAISPISPNSEQRNRIGALDARSSSTGTSSHNSRSRSGTEEPGDEIENENFSGEETDGESSILSHSSHGGNAYIEEPKKPKRTRTAYSNNQLDQLELVFSQTQYPDVFLREELAKSLGIKEDRIQVWFQNRRARFRKQERTGSVSFRSRYRQRRLQKVLQQSQAMSSVYSGYMSTSQGTPSTMLIPSPQPMASYVSNFPFPAQMPTVSASSSTEPLISTSTTGCLPGFHTLRPASIPLPNYVSRAVPNGSALGNRTPYTHLHAGVAPASGHNS